MTDVTVKCKIGLKSMNLSNIFVSLRNYEGDISCIWARSQDLILEEQPIKGKMLEGRISGTIIEEKEDSCVVRFYSEDKEKGINIPRKNIIYS